MNTPELPTGIPNAAPQTQRADSGSPARQGPLESVPAVAAYDMVLWGPAKQNYPGGPIYREGVSTGAAPDTERRLVEEAI